MNGIACLALVVVSSAASAQTASQITPPSFAPKLECGGGLAAPAGAENLFVRLAGVSVKDGLPELAAATAVPEARLASKRISGPEVFAAARDLEGVYAAAVGPLTGRRDLTLREIERRVFADRPLVEMPKSFHLIDIVSFYTATPGAGLPPISFTLRNRPCRSVLIPIFTIRSPVSTPPRYTTTAALLPPR